MLAGSSHPVDETMIKAGMKAIMYHYVRPDNPLFPYFKHLHLEDFIKQLDYFENTFGFVSKEGFKESLVSHKPVNGVVLTFDDGFKDHYMHVLPELLKRNLWGIFYIATGYFAKRKLIDVHRIHLLVGKHGGNKIAQSIRDIINEEMLSHNHINEFHTETYKFQDNEESVNYVKRTLNYYIDYKYRDSVIDSLMAVYFPNESEDVFKFYMTKSELEDMHKYGMVLGSHTENHPVMSRLSPEEQKTEIASSFQTIESITGDKSFRTFCYPYGGFHTFTDHTEKLLKENGCRFSFNVESRNIIQQDLECRQMALPRFDCNEFPWGAAR